MKKIFLLFAALTLLSACDKINEIEQPVPVETNSIMVSLSVTRHDSFSSTKATIKSAWADEDVIFVFFKGVAAPKYLEMKYDSSSDTWTPTAKNGLTSSDLSDAADKKMTAVYLPYGSTATVAASEGNFIFSDITYSGYFLNAELVTYTYDGDVLSGTLNMTAPALSSGSDKLIHFDISGFTSGHNYKLYQDYVKPLSFTSVSADGVLSKNEGAMGTAITGYEDGSMMSFSGILDASAVGNAVDYQFSIDDQTASIIYTRDAGTKTLSTSKFIGIGAINNNLVWETSEYYVDLGLSVKWARFNVGSIKPEGCGDFFSWGEIEPYYEVGYEKEEPQTHWRDGKMGGYDWITYKWCNGRGRKLTKYCINSESGDEGFTDTKITLDLEDDVAHVKWGGNWRMPTDAEWSELFYECTWEWFSAKDSDFGGVAGYKVTSRIVGYIDRFIFLPAPGYRYDTGYGGFGAFGNYWSSTLYSDDSRYARSLHFDSGAVDRYGRGERKYGFSVRPVCP